MIYKATFQYLEEHEGGGPGSWREVIKVLEGDNARDLQWEIDHEIANDNDGLQKHKRLKDIVKL